MGKKKISLLLGAGFSANMGYPLGESLNYKIQNFSPLDYSISSIGSLYKNSNNETNHFYDKPLTLLKEAINKYLKIDSYFNYEKFYDFIQKTEIETKSVVIITLNQLVSEFLKDKNENQYYQNQPFDLGSTFDGYTGFLNYIEKKLIDSTICVHTLNHDLFFESLNNTKWIKGEMTDGYSDFQTPFYEKRNHLKIKLKHFTNKYNSNIRLFKLHGSLDQIPFYKKDGKLDNYIKINFKTNLVDIFKEEIINKEETINRFFLNYHSDFLTGTDSKRIRYKETYYKKLFEKFEGNLNESDELIIIGYGCMDTGINEIIEKCFDYTKKLIKVIDPNCNSNVLEFCEKFNAKHFKTDTEKWDLDP